MLDSQPQLFQKGTTKRLHDWNGERQPECYYRPQATTCKCIKRSVALTEVRMLHRAPAHEQGVLGITASYLALILRIACSWGAFSYKRTMLRIVIKFHWRAVLHQGTPSFIYSQCFHRNLELILQWGHLGLENGYFSFSLSATVNDKVASLKLLKVWHCVDSGITGLYFVGKCDCDPNCFFPLSLALIVFFLRQSWVSYLKPLNLCKYNFS